jgi:hypothetical protein
VQADGPHANSSRPGRARQPPPPEHPRPQPTRPLSARYKLPPDIDRRASAHLCPPQAKWRATGYRSSDCSRDRRRTRSGAPEAANSSACRSFGWGAGGIVVSSIREHPIHWGRAIREGREKVGASALHPPTTRTRSPSKPVRRSEAVNGSGTSRSGFVKQPSTNVEARSPFTAVEPSKRLNRGHPNQPTSDACRLMATTIGPSKGVDVLLEAWRVHGRKALLPLLIAGSGDQYWLKQCRRRPGSLPGSPRAPWSLTYRARLPETDRTRCDRRAPLPFLQPSQRNLRPCPRRGTCDHRDTGARDARARIRSQRDPRAGGGCRSAGHGHRESLQRPEERDRLGAAALATATRLFSWDSHLDGLVSAYRLATPG